MADQIAIFLAKLVTYGGGVALITYTVMRIFASKWLSLEFDKKLRAYEHEHNKEIERLRSELTRSFDKRSKLHQREFEALPDVWSKVCDAYWNVRGLVSPFQQHPDLNRMNPGQLESFISGSDLASWQKDEIRGTSDKTRYYIDNIFWHRLHECRKLVTQASNSLGKSGIFISADTRRKLDELTQLLWNALTEEELNHSDRPSPRLKEDIDKLMKEGEELKETLEEEVRNILWEQTSGAP